jgi:hypothetical protein
MSMQRECLIFKAVNDKWYISIGNREYSDLDDATTYGPFESNQAAEGELEYHSNPGGWSMNDSGKARVPKCRPPTRRRW